MPTYKFAQFLFSVGVTTGRVFVGMVGGDTRCEYTLHGSLVNLAARLMVAAKDGVLISDKTFQKSRTVRDIDFEGPSFIKVKSYVRFKIEKMKNVV